MTLSPETIIVLSESNSNGTEEIVAVPLYVFVTFVTDKCELFVTSILTGSTDTEPITIKEEKLLPIMDVLLASKLYPPTFRLFAVLYKLPFALTSNTALVPVPSLMIMLFSDTATLSVKSTIVVLSAAKYLAV